MSKRDFYTAGHHFYADREPLARDGGDAGRWYAVRIDPTHGRVIDRACPPGSFRTMREAHEAVAFMYRGDRARGGE